MRIQSPDNSAKVSGGAEPPNPKRLIALESQLDWYYGEGSATFERSTFGDQLEHASLFAGATRPCFWCGGIPASVYGGEVPGSGFTETGAECRKCHGAGWVASDQRKADGALTAKPKPAARVESGYWPGHDALTRYATMSRVVNQVSDMGRSLELALRAFYGDIGARWGRHAYGRIFAVYPLTRAGTRLCETSRRRSIEALQDVDILQNEKVLQGQQPNDIRRLLFDRADREARVLHAEALHAAYRIWQ